MSIFLILILILLIANPNIVSQEVYNASSLWFTVLLPAMYPSFVIIDLLEAMPFTKKLSKILFPLFKILFKINYQKSAFIILMSLICGAPASTKMIQNSIEQKEISKREGENLVCAFSTLSMPYTILVCKMIALSFLLYYSLLILLCSILMHIINKKETTILENDSVKSCYRTLFFQSIKKNTDIIIHILGILIIFRVLIKIFFKDNFIFYPYIEILGGISTTKNPFLILSALGFLGFSVHLQIINIYPKLNYKKFILARIFLSSLCFLAFL